jgi:DNA-binding response OmpR family regulator
MNILIIEDNRDIAANIADYFEPLGHSLDFANSGTAGLTLALQQPFDVIVLDLMLPGMDGLAVCRELRARSSQHVPVLMLTARDQLDDKLQGFAAGADDYLVKPFSLRELEARLLALVTRAKRSSHNTEFQVDDLSYCPDTHVAQRAGHVLELNPVQRRLLEILMRQSHRVVTREELEREVWGDTPPETDLLRTHIYALRNVVDRPFAVKLIHTIHGTGYRLCRQA